MHYTVIAIDDEKPFLDSIRRGLIHAGFPDCRIENDPRRAAEFFLDTANQVDVALIDVAMPYMDGLELLKVIRDNCPYTECIMVTALNDAQLAVECLKRGAYDYLVKPITPDDLALAVKRALERVNFAKILDMERRVGVPKIDNQAAFSHILAKSPRMLRVLKEAELHARSCVPVLITGESGTGKELVARAIHLASPRSKYPFLPINMASLTDSIFDAEFFGHAKGAFTGAQTDRKGFIESVGRGTLFLDEIGSIPLSQQAKLLRVLQEKEFIKLGVNRPKKTDCRFVAATNADLEALMQQGAFRKDFYYRLNGAWIHLPPLRERRDDIPLLAKAFLRGVSRDANLAELGEDAIDALMGYDFPGNVRELKAMIESAVNLAQGGPIRACHLPRNVRRVVKAPVTKGDFTEIRPLADIEREYILKVYSMTGKNKAKTARQLGIGLNTLRRKLRSYEGAK